MGAFSGPETVDGGIVLVLDAQNPLSVGNTSLNVWEDVLSSTTTVSSVGVITCLSVDIASSQFFGQKYSSCLISGSTVWDNRPPSVSDMNEILSGNLTCKSYQTGTYDQVQYLFGAYGNAGNVCTLRFTGFGVGALIGVGGYFNAVSRQCRLTGDLLNSPVTITSPSGGFADPIVLTSDPADIQFENSYHTGGDPWYVYWLGPYNQVPYNTLRSSYGSLTNGPVFTQEPKQEPFGGAGAVEFDGTGDYLTVPSSTDLEMGTGDFTVEMWVYSTDSSQDTQDRRFFATEANATSSIQIGHINTTAGIVEYADQGSLNVRVTGTTDIRNQWAHIAVVRNSGTVSLYVNGVSEGTPATDSNSKTASTPTIGKYPGASGHFKGFMSNLRVVKGTALYTSNFTPKRQPLLPESAPNTVLLTCQKGTIKDRSSSAHAITVNGDAKSISGASYFEFDGTNDYVSISSSNDFAFGTSDFSIELWAYFQGSGSYENIFDFRPTSTNGNYPLLARDSVDGDLYYYVNSSRIIDNVSVSNNRWYHIVICREGTTTRFYLNGEIEGSATDSTNYITSNVLMGSYSGGGNYFNGKISGVKIYKGKGLTAAEVKQNYRNTKGRYGL